MVSRYRSARFAAVAVLLMGTDRAAAQDNSSSALRRELEGLRRELRALHQRVEQQQELINHLTREHATATPPGSDAPGTAALPTSSPPPQAWSPAQPVTLLRGGRGYLNLSLDLLTDTGWSTNPDVPAIELGDHDPNQRGFTLPNAELAFDGGVDPYFKGFANIVFKLNEDNETEVELEEAYGLTTALPWNLQLKAGQFLTEFGRINQQHPHAWDFVDVPLVSARLLGREGLRNPGARLSWLLPLPFYSELLGTVQDSQGSTAFGFRNTDSTELFGRTPVDRQVKSLGDLLWVPRWVSSFDLTDSQTVVAGVSAAFGPNSSGFHQSTQIYGADLYWKWKPGWQSGGFPFVALQAEGLARRYEAGSSTGSGGAPPLPSEVVFDYGTYVQALYGFRERWVAGLRYDWVDGQRGDFPDPNRDRRSRVSPNMTFYPTEFSKLRLQYNYDVGHTEGTDSSVWLQLELLLGDHAAHKF